MSGFLDDWLPPIPKNWRVKPLFALATERVRPNTGLLESQVLSLSYGKVVKRDVESNYGLLPDTFDGYNIVEPDDIVMRMTDLQNDQRSLRTGQVTERGIITSAYVTIVPSVDLTPRFAHFLLHGYDLAKVFYRMGGGLRQSLKYADLKRLPLLMPPRPEQTRIANFLDEQTARIDALIAEKERLDGLLGEYRASLISAAVTGQVDVEHRRVYKRGRGVSGWPVTRLRYVAELNPVVRQELLQAPETEVSFLPMEAIGEDGCLNLERTRPVTDVRNGYSYFEDGDVAFAKVTPCFENGKGALMFGLERAAGFGTTELTVLRPKQGTVPRFLHYVVQSSLFRRCGAAAMTGAGGLKRVPDEFTRDFTTPWPSFVEQTRIANFLDEQTARIDVLREHCRKHITLLREYRASLISAAVTGQLNVDSFGREVVQA